MRGRLGALLFWWSVGDLRQISRGSQRVQKVALPVTESLTISILLHSLASIDRIERHDASVLCQASAHMAETKWTPFGEFDPSKDSKTDELPPAPPSPKSTNPFFQRLEDVVFDPFANTPKKVESEERVINF